MIARILFLMMFPFMCFSQITPSEDIPVNNLLKEKENLDTKRKASYNLDEIKVRWKKAALENCPGVPCVVAPSFTCGTSTVSDVDGNAYNTKLIGSQCWTTSNLKVTKYNDGTLIGDSTNSTWGTAKIGARTEYAGVTGYVGTFGYLYNWYAVTDSRKLCPNGWHVPTDAEWTIMIQQLDNMASATAVGVQSATAGTAMKSTVTNPSMGSGLGWDFCGPSITSTNASGFSALPGGSRNSSSNFNNINIKANFWSATENPTSLITAMSRILYCYNNGVDRITTDDKGFGLSIRCLKD